jgi:hypothetical protein
MRDVYYSVVRNFYWPLNSTIQMSCGTVLEYKYIILDITVNLFKKTCTHTKNVSYINFFGTIRLKNEGTDSLHRSLLPCQSLYKSNIFTL